MNSLHHIKILFLQFQKNHSHMQVKKMGFYSLLLSILMVRIFYSKILQECLLKLLLVAHLIPHLMRKIQIQMKLRMMVRFMYSLEYMFKIMAFKNE